jgi:NADH:ubiquinone oxidoreductase subunit 4 (subunit M)
VAGRSGQRPELLGGTQDAEIHGYQFEQQIPWVESLGLSYHVVLTNAATGRIK